MGKMEGIKVKKLFLFQGEGIRGKGKGEKDKILRNLHDKWIMKD